MNVEYIMKEFVMMQPNNDVFILSVCLWLVHQVSKKVSFHLVMMIDFDTWFQQITIERDSTVGHGLCVLNESLKCAKYSSVPTQMQPCEKSFSKYEWLMWLCTQIKYYLSGYNVCCWRCYWSVARGPPWHWVESGRRLGWWPRSRTRSWRAGRAKRRRSRQRWKPLTARRRSSSRSCNWSNILPARICRCRRMAFRQRAPSKSRSVQRRRKLATVSVSCQCPAADWAPGSGPQLCVVSVQYSTFQYSIVFTTGPSTASDANQLLKASTCMRYLRNGWAATSKRPDLYFYRQWAWQFFCFKRHSFELVLKHKTAGGSPLERE